MNKNMKKETDGETSVQQRAKYLRPDMNVYKMELAGIIADSGGGNSKVMTPTDNSSDDNNSGRGSDYTSPWK